MSKEHIKDRRLHDHFAPVDRPNTKELTTSGIFLGLGMGGFFYSIVIHHLAQSSFMLSGVYYANIFYKMQRNIYWDGVLLASAWIATAIGISTLWAVARRNDVPLLKHTFGGAILMGWGAFNLVEGLVSHHLLGIHHIVQRTTMSNQLMWDYAYLGTGVILIGLGMWARAIDNNRVVIKRALA